MNRFMNALDRARDYSGFLARLLEQNPAITALLTAGQVEQAYAAAKAMGAGASGTAQALRWQRNALALVTAVADLAGAWDLTRVMAVLSDFADEALDAAITTAVNAELAKDSDLSAFKIDVDTSSGRVVLNGTAPSEQARDRATQLAAGVQGVVSVDNMLTIEPRKQ